MKPKILILLILIFFVNPMVGAQVEVKIPDKCMDILLPDTASYVVFLTDQKTHDKDNQMRLKVASLKDGRGLWSRKYYNGRRIMAGNEGLVFEDTFETLFLDYETGKSSRKIEGTPVLIDDQSRLILGVKGVRKKKIVATSMSDFATRWTRELDKGNEHPICVLARPDSSHMIALGDRLMELDLTNGEIKSMPINEVSVKSSINPGASLLSSALGSLLSGGMSFYIVNSVTVQDLKPNVIVCDSCIFISDLETIRCVGLEMTEKWTAQLPVKAPSEVRLTLDGDTLRMLNFGYVDSGGNRYRIGKPFIAKFDANTGESHSILFFPEKFDTDRFGKHLTFVSDSLFVRGDDGFYHVQSPIDGASVLSPDGKILCVDDELNVSREMDRDEVYIGAAILPDGSRYIKSGGEKPVFVKIDPEGREIERLPSSVRQVNLSGKRLIIVDGDILKVFEPGTFD